MPLIRFVSSVPSIFQALDDSTERESLILAVMLELVGRPVDAGRPSFWQTDEHTENRVVAQHAARRPSRDRLRLLRVPGEVVESAGLTPEVVPDEGAFECVSNLHREIDLNAEADRRALAEALVDAVLGGGIAAPGPFRSITRAQVGELVAQQHQLCVRAGGVPDADKAGGWVQPYLGS